MKAVVDTNVLVSGFISPKGFPAEVVDLWAGGKFALVTSKPILGEIQKVLNYPKIKTKYGLDDEMIETYLKGLRIFSEVCASGKRLKIIKDDPSDNMFLEAAVNCHAEYIVSGDGHLLSLEAYGEVKIVNAEKFVKILNKGE